MEHNKHQNWKKKRIISAQIVGLGFWFTLTYQWHSGGQWDTQVY